MRILKIFVVLSCIFFLQLLDAQSSPMPMLEQTAHKITTTLKENKKSLKNNPSIIYKAVELNLVPNVDVEGMSRSVLGRNAWNKASLAEKEQFSEAFTHLVIRTYASPLAQYSDESIQFLPLRVNNSSNNRFMRVNSIIVRTTGQNIPLTYSLIFKKGQWKIYDISVEGVSLLQSFKSQFEQILQNSGINELIKQMKKK